MKNEIVKKEENSLLVGTTVLNNDLFNSDNKTKKMTTLDLNDDEQADMFLNSDSNVDHKLNDCVGKVLDVVGATVIERPVTEDIQNEETGEIGTRTYNKHTLILFDSNGESYVSGSNSCYKSFIMIANVKGYLPSFEKHMRLEVIKVPAKTQGHSYLKLKAAK